MLQVFSLDVAKVDLDVAYVAMTIHACFNRMFHVFYQFQTYVASVSSGCFKSRSGRAHVSYAATVLLLLLGAPLWVTVRAPKAGRHLHRTHPQVGQVIGTHIGPGDGRVARDGLLKHGMLLGAACGRGGMHAQTLDGMRVDSGHGIRCRITRGNCDRTCRPYRRQGYGRHML